MDRAGVVFGIVAVFFFTFAVSRASFAQDFPYAVPQAPEFHTEGSVAPPAEVQQHQEPTLKHKSRRSHSWHVKRNQYSREHKRNYRSGRSYVRQVPPAPVMPYPQTQYPHPPSAPSTQMGRAAAPPATSPLPPQGQKRLDCSKFPMLIAQAKNDQQARWTAKMYLTCLIRSGWDQQQARQQVISTLQSMFGNRLSQ
jgi:hypothetical protein